MSPYKEGSHAGPLCLRRALLATMPKTFTIIGTRTTKIILVEAFPGSGKSPIAQWLARQWQLAGRACRWFYEQQDDHPVVGISPGAPAARSRIRIAGRRRSRSPRHPGPTLRDAVI